MNGGGAGIFRYILQARTIYLPPPNPPSGVGNEKDPQAHGRASVKNRNQDS
jgi:hypothetical protein